MRVALLITSIGNFGQRGFYNTQEIGLAKALNKLADEVIVYKAISKTAQQSVSQIEGCKHARLLQIPTKANGINGVWDCDVMDTTIDVLIYFSDTQIIVPKVLAWCKKNDVEMYPYIGVIESHSSSKIKKFIMNHLFARNLKVYKQCCCFVKTPTVQANLSAMGVKKCVVSPAGLDLSLLRRNYENTPRSNLKQKWGYKTVENVLLFIGRMTKEKQPLRMIKIFRQLYQNNDSYRLLMVGKGELKEEVVKAAGKLPVKFIDQIPNSDIWELYRIADTFVNLNQQEIFGMSILEAMYYGCKVVALKAPGPNYIIDNGVSGFLCDGDNDIMQSIKTDKVLKPQERILKFFTWEYSAKIMYNAMKGTNTE